MRCSPRSCNAESSVDLKQSLIVEQQHAEWFLAERVVPGAEVHDDADVTWIVHAGNAWRNAGIMVRFSPSSARQRLDTLVARYKRHGRGMALWVSPSARPADVATLLGERKLRCRKHFPAMMRDLSDRAPRRERIKGLTIRPVADLGEYEKTPHPAIGPLNTPLRRSAFERLRALVSEPSRCSRNFVAWIDDVPAGSIEMFVGSASAGIHGLSVLEAYQRRGIGSALVEHACEQAREMGAPTIGLLATTEGQRLYADRGFTEVARFGYWYRSFQRGC
jgi:GNAT superfamily N-acetyltransferase